MQTIQPMPKPKGGRPSSLDSFPSNSGSPHMQLGDQAANHVAPPPQQPIAPTITPGTIEEMVSLRAEVRRVGDVLEELQPKFPILDRLEAQNEQLDLDASLERKRLFLTNAFIDKSVEKPKEEAATTMLELQRWMTCVTTCLLELAAHVGDANRMSLLGVVPNKGPSEMGRPQEPLPMPSPAKAVGRTSPMRSSPSSQAAFAREVPAGIPPMSAALGHTTAHFGPGAGIDRLQRRPGNDNPQMPGHPAAGVPGPCGPGGPGFLPGSNMSRKGDSPEGSIDGDRAGNYRAAQYADRNVGAMSSSTNLMASNYASSVASNGSGAPRRSGGYGLTASRRDVNSSNSNTSNNGSGNNFGSGNSYNNSNNGSSNNPPILSPTQPSSSPNQNSWGWPGLGSALGNFGASLTSKSNHEARPPSTTGFEPGQPAGIATATKSQPNLGTRPDEWRRPTELGGLVLGNGDWAAAYRNSTGHRRECMKMLCITGIVTERELAEDHTSIAQEHIDECIMIAGEILSRWQHGVMNTSQAKAYFEDRFAAIFLQKAPVSFQDRP